jgi:hypothetical protein
MRALVFSPKQFLSFCAQKTWPWLLGIALGALLPLFLRSVSDWGHFIPQTDMTSDYALGVFTAVVIAVFVFVVPLPDQEKRALLWLWFAKCCVTLLVMLGYENSYGLDAYYYFTMASAQSFDWSHVSWGDGTSVVGGICWFLGHGLGVEKSYHALKVICSSLGLLGIYFFYLGSARYLGRRDVRLLYFLGLFPSILFWSSILGKDPINLLGVGVYFYGAISWKKSGRFVYLLPLLFGVAIAASIRLWYMLILLGPVLMLGRPGSSKRGGGPVSAVLTIVLLLFAIQFYGGAMGLHSTGAIVDHLNTVSRSWTFGGSALDTPEINSIGSMLSFAPLGMFTALFRPLPGEVMNLFGLIAGVENLFLLVLIAIAFRRSKLLQPADNSAWFWAFSLVVVWSFLYGFISFQNLGTAVRFKLQILPVLLTMLFWRLSNRNEALCAG